MRKPLIGITSSHEHNPESENAYKTSVSIDYSRAVMEAGFLLFCRFTIILKL